MRLFVDIGWLKVDETLWGIFNRSCLTFWRENLFGMVCSTRRSSLCKEFDGGGMGCSAIAARRCSNANPIFRLRFFSINWKCESTTQGDTDEKCESLEPTNWEIRDIANIYIKSEHISQTAWKDLWGNAFGGKKQEWILTWLWTWGSSSTPPFVNERRIE